MTAVIALAGVSLTLAALAGMLAPFWRRRALTLEGVPDPLEDERRILLRSLRELEEERAAGELGEDAYRALRARTERRAVAVLRALEDRDGAAWHRGELRPSDGDGRRHRPPGGRRRIATVVVAAAVVAAVALPLASAVRERPSGGTITGDPPAARDALEFFEARVREHPGDLAARLDLADRYFRERRPAEAVEQYRAALRIDPRNAEALARLGIVLFGSGRPEDALAAIDRALEETPEYPEAVYYRGVVLLRGLQRPRAAAAAFEAYLETAPFGAYREQAETLLAEAAAG